MKLSVRCLLPILATLGFAPPVQAEPAMWEVRDGDSAIWLFGAITELPEGVDWRTALFDDLLATADKIVLESDLDSEAATAAGAAFLSRGIYSDGTLLTDLLDSDSALRLREAAEIAGVPMGMVLSMRPWFAASAIAVGTQVRHGLGDNLASELQPELPADRLVFLNTIESELALLTGISEDEQLAILTSTLEQLGSMPKIAYKLRSNWVAGTPENVGDAFLTNIGGFNKDFGEDITAARNSNWMPQIEAMLLRNEENLVIVNTANIIEDGGLLDLLDAAGHTVERVQ